jgi:hypothetical protein
MNKLVSPPRPLTVTVGDLIGQLCRWPDQAFVIFKCPLDDRQLNFCQIESSSEGRIEITLDVAAERGPPIVPVPEHTNDRRR